MSSGGEVGCDVCVGQVELVNHLFVLFEVSYVIWYKVFKWLGWPRPLLR